ncbi:TetR family transcriptional regulator C-terminal domain-containing protein [Nocardioides sp. YIM 152315]|uniref:LmrA/YxaF family transcription factor n=1 Tax=Nocardioides sp. YIM 152315 TaxID=3031760 RepID=UPI0023DBE9D5|nr:TetR family transcriptional regulator C-terminal domain-containing protein [Nocardioides sp. YIM 152315]MDF1603015.1 TetR family transcriptional regulator C-terminal domain-containing protein [Nocardioides sp. YIM 152315]
MPVREAEHPLSDLRAGRAVPEGRHDSGRLTYGCALGALASEVSDHDALARQALSQLFAEWQELLAGVLRRLRDGGALPPEAPVDRLATGLMAALQGGYLLAQTEHDVTPMATSIDMALAHIESLSAG